MKETEADPGVPSTRLLGAESANVPTFVAGAGPGLTQAELPRLPGYAVLGVLGRGGMGIVYQARHLQLKRLVALKTVLSRWPAGSPERARFRLEAETVARLRHPNIVQIYDVGEHDGLPYLALEFLEGGSLDQRIARGTVPAADAARLVRTLAHAIHHAHEKGVLHRDLKPANVLLTADGTPKVTDFGLAKCLDADHGLTETGMPMGTAAYMAPEQATGRSRDLGPPMDVYALGAILYELLTGRPPFRAATFVETLDQVRFHDATPLSALRPGVPAALEAICLRCLAKDPQRRYASAADLAEELHRFETAEPSDADPAGSGSRPAEPAAGGTPREVGGGYRLLRPIGRGSLGEVWRAEASGGVAVAVREVPRPGRETATPGELEVLERMKAMRHSYLIQVQACWPESDRLLIVMELAEGSLADRLRQCLRAGLPHVPVAELLTYFEEAAEALNYLHGRGAVHGAVRPSSLLLLQRHIKLADFGLRELRELLGPGPAAGAGPEGRPSPAGDQYDLARSYVELRLGRDPGEAPDLAELPGLERQVLLRALAPDPARRYRTCREFVQQLGQVLAVVRPSLPADGPLTDRSGEAGWARRVGRAGRLLQRCFLGGLLGSFFGAVAWSLLAHAGALAELVRWLGRADVPGFDAALSMLVGAFAGMLRAVSGRPVSRARTAAAALAVVGALLGTAWQVSYEGTSRVLSLYYGPSAQFRDRLLLGVAAGALLGLLLGQLLERLGRGRAQVGGAMLGGLLGAFSWALLRAEWVVADTLVLPAGLPGWPFSAVHAQLLHLATGAAVGALLGILLTGPGRDAPGA